MNARVVTDIHAESESERQGIQFPARVVVGWVDVQGIFKGEGSSSNGSMTLHQGSSPLQFGLGSLTIEYLLHARGTAKALRNQVRIATAEVFQKGFEGSGGSGSIVEAIGFFFGGEAGMHRFDDGIDAEHDVGDAGHFFLQDLHQRRAGIFRIIRTAPAHQVVQNEASRKEITAAVEGVTLDLLRTHEGGGAHQHPCRRQRVVGRGLSDAKVDQLQDAAAREHQIRRLEIAVNDADLVGGTEGLDQLAHNFRSELKWQRAAEFLLELTHRAAVDDLHRHE